MAIRSARRPPRPDRAALVRWLATPRARRLRALSEACLAARLPEVFGRETIQVGGFPEAGLLAGAGTVHAAVLAGPGVPGADAWVQPEHLPLPSASVDAVLLPHTLEFCALPHQVLREVDRVLNDRGRLFVLGFNPWSPWALGCRLGLAPRWVPRLTRFTSVGRLEDWLGLLDYEVTEVHRFSPGFPWVAPHSDGVGSPLRRCLQPLQEVYLLAARKRVVPMNRLPRLQRVRSRPLVGVPVVRRERLPGDGAPPAA